eukprot:gnl/TRDRNA2_/TRDRNA2_39176_c0_seq1.p1 gnl/TRDRNA2_/TRDRNA2_39176_c0~~gnl/TRDRNA2_/TRDRNA2_39176_c0_seq1.p1  ORF type:complete len:173 (-),score=30.74 gnl/TRDRNA2_/TRDRNA2_39176_c0_seq1:115-633(-)
MEEIRLLALFAASLLQIPTLAAADVQSINAVTLATDDMKLSYSFYRKLGLDCTFGGPAANFTTFGSPGGPGSGSNSYHINIFFSPAYKRPAQGWNGWGRAIFYVSDVDAMYTRIKASGLQPEARPADAPWGERYFQILDPMGHELSFARPLAHETDTSAASKAGADVPPVLV